MLDISTDIISYELKINPTIKLIDHSRKALGEDITLLVRSQVGKLLDTSFAKDIPFQTWMDNIILVKKVNMKWRKCVDFKTSMYLIYSLL